MNFNKLRIKELRKARGIMQKELADKLGLSSNATVCMWESGERMPSVSMLPRIAGALGCTINDLFAEDEEQLSSTKGA